MVKPQKLPETGPAGDIKRAINRVADFAESMKVVRGSSYEVRHMTSGQLLRFRGGDGKDGTSGLRRMKVIEDNIDTLTCEFVDEDGNSTGEQELVAKPESLRVTTYDGVTVVYLGGTFTITHPNASTNVRRLTDQNNPTRYFDENLWPPYTSGGNSPSDYIYVSEPDPGTGIEDVDLLDVNVSGRQFHPIMTLLATCVIDGQGNESVQYLYVAGGPVRS